MKCKLQLYYFYYFGYFIDLFSDLDQSKYRFNLWDTFLENYNMGTVLTSKNNQICKLNFYTQHSHPMLVQLSPVTQQIIS